MRSEDDLWELMLSILGSRWHKCCWNRDQPLELLLRLSRSHFLSTLLTRMLTLITNNVVFKICPPLLFCDSVGILSRTQEITPGSLPQAKSYSWLFTSGKLCWVHRQVNLAQAYFLFTLLFKWGQTLQTTLGLFHCTYLWLCFIPFWFICQDPCIIE